MRVKYCFVAYNCITYFEQPFLFSPMPDAHLKRYQQRFARIYPDYLPTNPTHIGTVYDAMHYSFAAGGKRLRPALVYALADSLQIDLQRVDAVAVAVECIHTYSLIHDDLPDMDDDDFRRGKPACHTQFGTATAILAGDALNTLAFEVLSSDAHADADKRLRQIQLLARCAGIDGMVGGQDIDLTCENSQQTVDIETLATMHRKKTAKLIEACLLMAYNAADVVDADKTALLSTVALSLGLLYQIQDDILDVSQSTEVLGKPANSDRDNGKVTYVSLQGLPQARQIATETATDINRHLHAFFAPERDYTDSPLAAIIDAIIKRQH